MRRHLTHAPGFGLAARFLPVRAVRSVSSILGPISGKPQPTARARTASAHGFRGGRAGFFCLYLHVYVYLCLGSLAAGLSIQACGGGESRQPVTAHQLDQAFRRIQLHEARLETLGTALEDPGAGCEPRCEMFKDLAAQTRHICLVAQEISDADAMARCAAARHAEFRASARLGERCDCPDGRAAKPPSAESPAPANGAGDTETKDE